MGRRRVRLSTVCRMLRMEETSFVAMKAAAVAAGVDFNAWCCLRLEQAAVREIGAKMLKAESAAVEKARGLSGVEREALASRKILNVR